MFANVLLYNVLFYIILVSVILYIYHVYVLLHLYSCINLHIHTLRTGIHRQLFLKVKRAAAAHDCVGPESDRIKFRALPMASTEELMINGPSLVVCIVCSPTMVKSKGCDRTGMDMVWIARGWRMLGIRLKRPDGLAKQSRSHCRFFPICVVLFSELTPFQGC